MSILIITYVAKVNGNKIQTNLYCKKIFTISLPNYLQPNAIYEFSLTYEYSFI